MSGCPKAVAVEHGSPSPHLSPQRRPAAYILGQRQPALPLGHKRSKLKTSRLRVDTKLSTGRRPQP